MVDHVETMAYAGAKPWHELGKPVNGKLSPARMARAAEVDWEVKMIPSFYRFEGDDYPTGDSALVRMTDGKLLDTVPNDWNPVQNQTAWEFFDEFCKEGKMSMETMGSLKGGQLVWALARINASFELFRGKDTINGYMLFTNPHLYGWSTSVSFTAIRVVCWNTLNLSLNTAKGDKIVKISHRVEFIAEQAKEALGIATTKLAAYEQMAKKLTRVKAPKEDIVEYFKRIFPVLTAKTEGSKKELSKPTQKILEIFDTQPGADLGRGTWWQGYNAVTYYLDHLAGTSTDTRLTSAWYGEARKKKVAALELAVEMAK